MNTSTQEIQNDYARLQEPQTETSNTSTRDDYSDHVLCWLDVNVNFSFITLECLR